MEDFEFIGIQRQGFNVFEQSAIEVANGFDPVVSAIAHGFKQHGQPLVQLFRRMSVIAHQAFKVAIRQQLRIFRKHGK